MKSIPVENWTDVTINLSFILLALLSCENSFDKAICHAVNMGHDADCTGATVGALFGIINPDGIGERWTRPDRKFACAFLQYDKYDRLGFNR